VNRNSRQILTGNFWCVQNNAIGIDWADSTKTTRTDPFRPSRYMLVTGDLVPLIAAALNATPAGRKFTNLTTDEVTTILKRVDPTLTSYSIRHGALRVLAQAAAAGKIRPQTVSVMAKHKFDALMASTTIRYVQDPMSLAKIFETDKATFLL